jgi:arsenate reductase-like glutaredoxin family protein
VYPVHVGWDEQELHNQVTSCKAAGRYARDRPFYKETKGETAMKKWIIGSAIGVVVIVGGGAWYAYHTVQEKIGEQVVAILKDPATQSEINKIIANLPQNVNSSVQKSTSNAMTRNSSISNEIIRNNSLSNAITRNNSISSPITSSSVGAVGSSSTDSVRGAGSAKSLESNNDSNESIPTFTSREQVIAYAESHFTESEILHYLELYEQRGSLTQAEKDEIKKEILSHFTPAEIQAMEAALKKYP